jgi:hypothetical protein
MPYPAGRTVNLYEPGDEHEDKGARGNFSDKAGGFWDPSFLKSMPSTAVIFLRALGRTAAEKRKRYTVRVPDEFERAELHR